MDGTVGMSGRTDGSHMREDPSAVAEAENAGAKQEEPEHESTTGRGEDAQETSHLMSLLGAIAELNGSVTEMNKQVTAMKTQMTADVKALRADVKTLRTDVRQNGVNVGKLRAKMSADVDELKQGVSHLTEDVAALKKDVAALKKDAGELKSWKRDSEEPSFARIKKVITKLIEDCKKDPEQYDSDYRLEARTIWDVAGRLIFIRDITPALYEEVIRGWFTKVELPGELKKPTTSTRVRITGSPGTGKTLSLWVILIRFIAHVQLHHWWDKIRLVCQFDTASAAIFQPEEPADDIVQFVFVDLSTSTSNGVSKHVPVPRVAQGDESFAVMTCSPDITNSAMDCGVQLTYPPWQLAELQTAYAALHNKWNGTAATLDEKLGLVLEAFQIVGGVARTVLVEEVDPEACKSYITSGHEVNATKLLNVLGYRGDGGVAHKYLHVTLVNVDSQQCVYDQFHVKGKIVRKLRVASRYVESLLCTQKCMETFAYMVAKVNLDPNDGKPYEIVAHTLLREKHGFAIELLTKKERLSEKPAELHNIDLRGREAVLMGDVSEIVFRYGAKPPDSKLKELESKYFYPANQSHAAIDALAWAEVGGKWRWVLLQMTVSLSHPIKLETLANNWTSALTKNHPLPPRKTHAQRPASTHQPQPPHKKPRRQQTQGKRATAVTDWDAKVWELLGDAWIVFVVPSYNMKSFRRQRFQAAQLKEEDRQQAALRTEDESKQGSVCTDEESKHASVCTDEESSTEEEGTPTLRQFVLPIALGPNSAPHSVSAPAGKLEFSTMKTQCTPVNLAHVNAASDLCAIPGIGEISAKAIWAKYQHNPRRAQRKHKLEGHAIRNQKKFKQWLQWAKDVSPAAKNAVVTHHRNNLLTYDSEAPLPLQPFEWQPTTVLPAPTSLFLGPTPEAFPSLASEPFKQDGADSVAAGAGVGVGAGTSSRGED